jgi:hypothetical protein
MAFNICALLEIYAAFIGSVCRRFGRIYQLLFEGKAVQKEANLLLFLMVLLYSVRFAL